MLLELVVEEISEIEYRTVQQEIELYNVTLPELTGNGTMREELTKRRGKGRKKGREGWENTEDQALADACHLRCCKHDCFLSRVTIVNAVSPSFGESLGGVEEFS